MSERGTPATLQVVCGDPTAAELAALVTVLSARTTATVPATAPRGRWGRLAGLVRRLPPPGPGAWRISALPI